MSEIADPRVGSSDIFALLNRFTQDMRLIRLTTPLGAHLLAECVRSEEGISQGYAFKIDALCTDAHIKLKTLLGQPALLQLLTATGGDMLRPFHGHITAVEMSGANGGFARYILTVEPWSTFLSLGRDSRIFQDMDVFDILDAVFRSYQGRGTLVPAWRFDLVDRGVYPKRSLTTQYQESDLAFVERLMHEEGLFYFFEHSSDSGSPTLGCHTMVIADHNGAFMPNVQASVNFTRPSAVMKEDSIDRWRSETRMSTNAIEISSWDYRVVRQCQINAAAGNADGPQLTSRDTPGVYAFQSREQGQRIARNQLQALEASRQVHIGAGTVRTLCPGTTFTLNGHARFDQADSEEGRTFAIVRVAHLMHNNLSADLLGGITKLLGKGVVAKAGAEDRSLHAVGSTIAERPLYRNRIDAILNSIPYRSSSTDGQGRLLHPRPTVPGPQTAIVVGPPGAMIHTDRDHRIKVQFHWQRGTVSHSRLSHPSPEGHTGAPGDDTAGTWVRAATPLAGANWGSNMLPRVGQEVMVDFFEGNIDRPVVIGTLYNGRGHFDAQYNQASQGAGAATGNAAAWFPGESGGNAHPAVLSGIKTQAMQTSQTGTGGYSQLVFDDSPSQARIALQRHAKPHEGTSELNLGQLRHQTDNQRLAPAGFGAELKTEHSLAVRAARGMLFAADRASTGTSVLESESAAAQVEQSHALQQALALTAQKHNACLQDEQAPNKLAPIAEVAHTVEVLRATHSSVAGGHGDGGSTTAYSEAHLQLSAPSGIAAFTPASAMIAVGTTTSIGAGQDINFATQSNAFHAVKAGISLFTYGKASSANKPNKETGIRLHAASGKVSSQSQAGTTQMTADKAITVASVTKSVSVAAKEHVLLTAQGAYIRLAGGNIEVHGPGTMTFKATMKELAGPQNSSLALPALPKSQAIVDALEQPLFSQQIVAPEVSGLTPEYAGMPYQIWKRGKPVQVASGALDENGMSARVFTDTSEDLTVIVGDASWEVIVPDESEPSPKGDVYE
jgi:type VI secretion system secreted protein VgrG